MKIQEIEVDKDSGEYKVIMMDGDEEWAYDNEEGIEMGLSISPDADPDEIISAGKSLMHIGVVIKELTKEFPKHKSELSSYDDDHEWMVDCQWSYEEWEQIYQKYRQL